MPKRKICKLPCDVCKNPVGCEYEEYMHADYIASTKPPNRIDEDTCILPHVIAESVVAELDLYLLRTHKRGLIDHARYAQILVDRAERIYEARPDIRKKFKRNATYGRDWLYCFMRHWLAGELKDFSQYIPAHFANGQPASL